MDCKSKMEESNKTNNADNDEFAKKIKEMSSEFCSVAFKLRNAFEAEVANFAKIVDAVKIVGEEAAKIAEKIPVETPAEAQKQMAEGMMTAALGAASLFGNLIKEGFSLADLGIKVVINNKEEQTNKDSRVEKDVKEAVDEVPDKASSDDKPEEMKLLVVSQEEPCQNKGPLPCCDGHPNEDIARLVTRHSLKINSTEECGCMSDEEGSEPIVMTKIPEEDLFDEEVRIDDPKAMVHECNDDVCVLGSCEDNTLIIGNEIDKLACDFAKSQHFA